MYQHGLKKIYEESDKKSSKDKQPTKKGSTVNGKPMESIADLQEAMGV